jgi:hypothetical protein
MAIVRPQKNIETLTINSLKKTSNHSYVSTSAPWRIFRFMTFDSLYASNKKLKLENISVKTKCHGKNRIFKIQILSGTPNSHPNTPLHNKEILCYPKKGKNITLIDLNKNEIFVPSEGFYIAVEALILPQNKHTRTVKIASRKQVLTTFDPEFYTQNKNDINGLWIFHDGTFRRPITNWNSNKTYPALAISAKVSVIN